MSPTPEVEREQKEEGFRAFPVFFQGSLIHIPNLFYIFSRKWSFYDSYY